MSLASTRKSATLSNVLISVPVFASLMSCNVIDSKPEFDSSSMKFSALSSLSGLCLSRSASIVGLSDTSISLSGNGSIGGSVVLLGRSTLDLSGNASVTDRVYAPKAAAVVEHGNASVGQLILQDLTPNESAVLGFVNTVLDQAPTQTFDHISNDLDITGNGGLNVIKVKNGIQLAGQKRIRLRGNSNDQFIFIVDQGNIQFSGGAGIQVAGSVSSRRVLFMAAGRQSLSVSGNGSIVGTYFLPEGPVSITGNGKLEGALLAESRIDIHGNGLSFTPAAWCPQIDLPMPSPSPSAEPSASPSVDPSVTPTPSATPSVDPSASPEPSASPTPSASPEPSVSPSADPSVTPDPSPSPTDPVCSGPFCDIGPILGT